VAVTSPTLIYDGACGFYTTSATWVSRHWTGPGAPIAIPWQQLSVESASELRLSQDDFARSVWWIDGGRVEGGFRAIARALMATHGPLAIVGCIHFVPPVSWVAPLGYRLVAGCRHRLPGGTPACKT
jgi:predicted DCC family thiol-disulfide oxidoreductase YuxK